MWFIVFKKVFVNISDYYVMQLSNEEIADMFDGSDDDADFMDTEAAEDDFKDIVEEHEDEVKQHKKKSTGNAIEEDDDNDNFDMGEWARLQWQCRLKLSIF